jgi:hypothetical protein
MNCFRPLMFFATIIYFSSCGNTSSTGSSHPATPSSEKVYYPYAPRFDVDGSGGNDKKTAKVLSIWQGYAGGNILNYRNLFADELSLIFHDIKITGSRDSILELYQKRSQHISTLQTHFNFWHPVHEAEKNEDWVLVWLNEEATLHTGQLSSESIHQVWKFNGDDRIYEMQEFRSVWNW